MSVPEITAAGAAAALVLVALVRSRQPYSFGKALVAGAIGFVLAAAVIALVPKRSGGVYKADSARLAYAESHRIHLALRDSGTTDLILLQGSSYARRGILGRQLEELLQQRGVRVLVAELSLPGSNLFEQCFILQEFLRHLSPMDRKSLSGMRITVLQEIAQRSETDPLAGFKRNEQTLRSYAYLDLPNTLTAMRAMKMRRANSWSWLWAARKVWVHPLYHLLSIGYFTVREMPQEHPRIALLQARQKRPRRFEPKPVPQLLPGKRAKSPAAPRYGWVRQIHVPRLREVLAPLSAQLVYFHVPTPRRSDAKFALRFCGESGEVCLHGQERGLLRALDEPDFWADQGHLWPAGARVYTAWLAGKLTPILSAPGLLR